MKPSEQSDIPGTRLALETVSTKFNIYSLSVVTLVGAVLAIVGFIGIVADRDSLGEVPDSVLVMAVGLIAFSLFFPWFMALYFFRHLLWSVKRIEVEIAALRTTGTESGPRV